MPILALDLGTTTGWAIMDEGKLLKSGYKSFAKYRKDLGKFYAMWRYYFFYEIPHIAGISSFGSNYQVVYEEVGGHFKTYHVPKLFGGFEATLCTIAYEMGVNVYGIHPMKIKKEFTGKGTATKEDILKKVHELGYTYVSNDNEADAIALAYVYERFCHEES